MQPTHISLQALDLPDAVVADVELFEALQLLQTFQDRDAVALDAQQPQLLQRPQTLSTPEKAGQLKTMDLPTQGTSQAMECSAMGINQDIWPHRVSSAEKFYCLKHSLIGQLPLSNEPLQPYTLPCKNPWQLDITQSSASSKTLGSLQEQGKSFA